MTAPTDPLTDTVLIELDPVTAGSADPPLAAATAPRDPGACGAPHGRTEGASAG
ncbi:hypothetical protein [Rhodococcus sp. JVH1]|uniref:hypothetical protein n=1 Tax=Rhodococcus sp. JVH1 TaxID=745408 RepID=UPI000272187C|nr:hypothetical protein [Rhodococcus sp. JVH1]EJI93907.1 hypothetical protein JVH1_8770 [Rhodococcus sp. JVH1]